MKEYFITLCGVMILSTAVGTACAEGNIKKYVRLLCSLCLVCALISPILSLGEEGEFDLSSLWEDLTKGEDVDYDEIYHQALIDNEVTYAEELLKNKLSEEFDLEPSSLDVEIDIVSKNGTNQPELIRIVLRDNAIFADPQKLIQYINTTQKCECVIIYD